MSNIKVNLRDMLKQLSLLLKHLAVKSLAQVVNYLQTLKAPRVKKQQKI